MVWLSPDLILDEKHVNKTTKMKKKDYLKIWMEKIVWTYRVWGCVYPIDVVSWAVYAHTGTLLIVMCKTKEVDVASIMPYSSVVKSKLLALSMSNGAPPAAGRDWWKVKS